MNRSLLNEERLRSCPAPGHVLGRECSRLGWQMGSCKESQEFPQMDLAAGYFIQSIERILSSFLVQRTARAEGAQRMDLCRGILAAGPTIVAKEQSVDFSLHLNGRACAVIFRSIGRDAQVQTPARCSRLCPQHPWSSCEAARVCTL